MSVNSDYFDENNYRNLLNLCVNIKRLQIGQMTGTSGEYEAMWERIINSMIKNINEINEAPQRITELENKWQSANKFERSRIERVISGLRSGMNIALGDIQEQLKTIAAFSGEVFKENIDAIVKPIETKLGDQKLKSELLDIHTRSMATVESKHEAISKQQKQASDNIKQIPALLLEVKRLQREAELHSTNPSDKNSMMHAQRYCSQANALIKQIYQFQQNAKNLIPEPFSEENSKRFAYLNKAVEATQRIESEIRTLNAQIKHDTTPENITSLDEAQSMMLYVAKSNSIHSRKIDDKLNKKLNDQINRIEEFFRTHAHLRANTHPDLMQRYHEASTEILLKNAKTPSNMSVMAERIYMEIKYLTTEMSMQQLKDNGIINDWKKLPIEEKLNIRDKFREEFNSNQLSIDDKNTRNMVNNFLLITRQSNKELMEEKINNSISNLPSPPPDNTPTNK